MRSIPAELLNRTRFASRLSVAWVRPEAGQTLAEYGILVGFIAVVVVAAAILLGHDISSLFVPVVNYFI